MANWDHQTNIGTHPVIDPDPTVRLPAIIEAADREIAKFQAIKAEAEESLRVLTAESIFGHVADEEEDDEDEHWNAFMDHDAETRSPRG